MSREEETVPADAEQETHTGIWQWLFIAIVLACWLAEATLCAARGY
jgi:hypothetical protein